MRVESDSLKESGDYWLKDREESKSRSSSIHKGNEEGSLSRKEVVPKDRSSSDHRVRNTFSETRGGHDTMIEKNKKPEVSGGAGLKASWGGTDKPTVTFIGEVNVKDKTNTYTVQAEGNNTGEKTVSVNVKKNDPSENKK